MAEMSPLASLLMRILRNGAIAAAALLVLFITIAVYQALGPNWDVNGLQNEAGFIGVLVAMLMLAIYLVRSIGKELDKPGK
jgi:hypothetical protein